MSDRTPHTVTIVSKDRNILAAARDIFDRLGGVDESREEGNKLTLEGHEITCGTSEDIARELDTLRATHGEFAYDVSESPKYEWLGSMHIYAPDAGAFSSDCDDNGSACITAGTLDALADQHTDPVAFRDAVAVLTGRAVREAFAAYEG